MGLLGIVLCLQKSHRSTGPLRRVIMSLETEISAVGSSGRVSKRLWCQSLKGDLAPALIIVFLPSTQKHRVNSLVRLEQNDDHQRRQQVAKSWVLRLTAAASPGPAGSMRNSRPVRFVYQPPASNTFLSEQTSHLATRQ
jgi:hypothetical protein